MPKKKKKAASKSPAKTVTKPGKGKFGAKAAFVRAHPNSSAQEVVDLAAKAGLTMTVNHVYNVRSTSGISRRKPSAVTRVGAGPKPGRGKEGMKSSSTSEANFRRLVLEIGVARARTLLQDIDTKLAAIVAGR